MTERILDFSWISPGKTGYQPYSAASPSAAAPARTAATTTTAPEQPGLLSTAKDIGTDAITDVAGDYAKEAIFGAPAIPEAYQAAALSGDAYQPAASYSPGTSAWTNVGNAAGGAVASYAGGKLANEIFDNKGYSDAGGSIGAGLGFGVGVGSIAAGTSAAATLGSLGWAAGPAGALAGALIGAAIGSLFGSSGVSDSSFRTYSGESSDEVSGFNKERATAAGLDAHDGYRQLEAGAAYTTLNTFDYGRAPSAHDANLGSIDTAFGKYSIGLIDEGDLTKAESFSESWLSRIEAYDAAFASILSPQEIALAKEGLAGTAQASKEWEDTQEFNVTTSDMLVDRYARIAQLVGRDDLYTQLSTGMTGGEFNRSQGGDMLASVIRSHMPEQRASTVFDQINLSRSAA